MVKDLVGEEEESEVNPNCIDGKILRKEEEEGVSGRNARYA